MPGRRLNASISFATGSMSRVATRARRSAAEQPAQATERLHRAHLLLGQAARGIERFVDRGGHEVLEHLDVIGIDGRRIDGHRHQRLLAGDNGAHHPAAGRPLDLGLGQLGLDTLHLLLHLHRHALQVAHAHRSLPSVSAQSAGCRVGVQGGHQPTSAGSAPSSPKIRRASARTQAASSSVGRSGTTSMFVATQRTATDRPSTAEMFSSSTPRRRSATARRNDLSSGKPRVTTPSSTLIGRHTTMSGFVGGWALMRATISGQRSRSTARSPVGAGVATLEAAAVGAGASGGGGGGASAAAIAGASAGFETFGFDSFAGAGAGAGASRAGVAGAGGAAGWAAANWAAAGCAVICWGTAGCTATACAAALLAVALS